jgi:hypothetical protein
MAAPHIAQNLQMGKIEPRFVELLVEKFSGTEFTSDQILADEHLSEFFKCKKVKAKAKKAPTPKKSPMERALEDVNHDKCLARVWGGGYGGQCSRKSGENGCFCKLHQGKVDEYGSWFFGLVTEPRPVNPTNPEGKGGKNGVHTWKITVDGEEIVKEKKKSSPKKKVEKKKSSPKKKVEKPVEKPVEEPEPVQEPVEEPVEDNGAGTGLPSVYETIIFEGVSYLRHIKKNLIVNGDDFSEVGEWIEEENVIRFEDEETEEEHKEKRRECNNEQGEETEVDEDTEEENN